MRRRHGRPRGVRHRPPGKDAPDGPPRVYDLARIYLLAGRPDDAVARLERLLKRPGSLASATMLRADPEWRPLADHNGFRRLIGGLAKPRS